MKTKIILIISILLAFAAGTSLGIFLSQDKPRKSHIAGLADELKLNTDQKEQIQKIWDEYRKNSQTPPTSRGTLSKQRDEAVAKLLNDQQMEAYQAIQNEYSEKMSQLSQERKKAFEQTVAKIKEVLTPQQATKYDDLMKKLRQRGRSSGRYSYGENAQTAPAAAPENKTGTNRQ